MMRQCEFCGASLDPQEICDCRSHFKPDEPSRDLILRCVAPPVISANITALTAYIDDTLSLLSTLEQTREGCIAAKAMRADLRKRLEVLENQRKAVKKSVIQPYADAEKEYNEKIKAPLSEADARLKGWIDDYQNASKADCAKELQAYFDELCDVLHIDFVTFDQTGVVVDMATATLKDPKKARAAICDFLHRIDEDRRAISAMDHAEEIMADYRQSLSLSDSIASVYERQRRIAESASEIAALKNREATAQNARQALYTEAPEIIPDEEALYTATIHVTETLPQLRALKAFLDANHYNYVQEE